MPWSVGQLVLSESSISRARGWDATVERLCSSGSRSDAKLDELATSLKEHLLCGEKLIRFYELSSAEKDELLQHIHTTALPEGPAVNAYPALLSVEDMASHPSGLQLVSVEHRENGTALVYSSIRTITQRVEISKTELSQSAAEELSDFEEIYAVKNTKLQAIDTLWVPNGGNYVDVRVDYPLGMLRQTGEIAQLKVCEAVVGLVGKDILGTPLNLFPLIDQIYKAKDEGTVVELAFGTTTASIKHEKMRRRHSDLRNENYHVGGKAALNTPIEPYKLSVVYKRRISERKSSTPELSLHSSVRISGKTQPVLTDAVVRKCIGFDDFDHVRSRIEHFLSINPQAPDNS